jgi:hypothetical protein
MNRVQLASGPTTDRNAVTGRPQETLGPVRSAGTRVWRDHGSGHDDGAVERGTRE